jgi:CubicO group peptidase (beta-lactamase class C family)
VTLVGDHTARRLLAALARVQRDGQVPSVVAALTRDGSLVWRGSHGDATGESGARPADLQYRIGSITKTMTAVLVMQARDDGLLDLAAPVAEHLPDVDLPGVTLRHLLSHSAGLAAEPAGEWWERTAGGSFADLAARLGEARGVLASGRTHHYSNLGYGLLGEVVARVRGRTWWEVLSARLLEPLGMLRTTYDPFAPHAHGFSVDPWAGTLSAEPATDTAAMAPAGQVWSTVLDLATYADFLLDGDDDVLPLRTLEEMSTPQSGTYADGAGDTYGLGLRLLAGGSGTLVGHTGSMPGFQASLFVDRPRRAGAVVLANSTTGLPTDTVAASLLDLLEEVEPAVVAPWRPVTDIPPAVADVLGLWHWGNTPLVLRWDGATVTMTGLDLDPHDADVFALQAGVLVGVAGYHHGEPLTAVRRGDGSVSHLVVSTFVLTRTPYDPDAPIPGGFPA